VSTPVLNAAVATALVSAAVSAGTAGASFLAGRTPGWRDFNRFGWVALTAAVVSFANAGNTLDLAFASPAWTGRVQFLFFGLHVLAWHGYVSEWARAPLGRGAAAAVAGITVVPGVLGLWPGLLYTDVYSLRPVPWLGLAYRDAQASPSGVVLLVLLGVAALCVYGRVLFHARRGAPAAPAHVAAGLLLLAIAAHDAALTLGLAWPTPYLIDFSFYVPIAGLGLTGLHRLSRASAELAQLRDRLEARVEERTGELARAQAALARAERLAALGQLSAGVAHEVNNPAAIISSSLAFATAELGPAAPPEVRAALDDARSAVGRIAALTRELLVAGRAAAQPMPLVPVDLASAVHVAVQAARARATPTVQVVAEVPAGLAVLAQGGPLEQVLGNLAVNAVQAIPAGRAGLVAIRAEEAGARVRITVEDDGEGMGPEALRRAGEPFFSTKPVGVGSGLGVAVARGLASAMSGTLAFDSAPGRGTRVVVELDRAEAAGP